MATAAYAWNGVHGTATIAAGASVSNLVAVPRDVTTLTIYTPAVSAAGDWKLQSLVPSMQGETEVWGDIYSYDETSGLVTMIGPFDFSASAAFTFVNRCFGSGNLRIRGTDVETAVSAWRFLFS